MSAVFLSLVLNGVLSGILISFILGMLHGITPDEHTWPITFSYAIGSYSTRKGAEAGLVFSAGFTLERALMSEAFFVIFNYSLSGIKNILQSSAFFASVYIVVGFAMGVAGYYIKYGRWYPHLEVDKLFSRHMKPGFKHKSQDFYSKKIPLRMAAVHGLIAGFGMGAFALIIFTIIAPSMPNIYLGFLPGLFFGLGTMLMQVIFGALFGTWVKKIKKLTDAGVEFLAHYMSAAVLLYGGIIFVLAGMLSLAFPVLLSLGISTGIPVYNLSDLNIGFFLVVSTVVVIAIIAYLKGSKLAVNVKRRINRVE